MDHQGFFLGRGNLYVQPSLITVLLSHSTTQISLLYLQLEDQLLREFEKISEKLEPIDWRASGGIKTPSQYVETYRILLWDKAFLPFFNAEADPVYKKETKFTKYPGTGSVVQRVLYRYYKFYCSTLSFSSHFQINIILIFL